MVGLRSEREHWNVAVLEMFPDSFEVALVRVTNSGADYFNHYVIDYELTDGGTIHTVWEYLDNVYSQDKFDLAQL